MIDLLLCFPFQNVLCLEADSFHLQNFLFLSLLFYCVPGLYVRMGCQIYSLRVLSLIKSKPPGTFSFLYYYESSICYYEDLLPNIAMANSVLKVISCVSVS